MTMYLPDSNVWFAMANRAHEHHPVASGWLASVPDEDTVVLCRPTEQSLLRLLTTAAAFRGTGEASVRSNTQAWGYLDAFLADSRISFMSIEPPGLDPLWRQYSSRATPSPKLWMDAYLAAFARAGRFRFVTFDSAFRQFEGLDLLVLE